jgi:hypothetical protein
MFLKNGKNGKKAKIVITSLILRENCHFLPKNGKTCQTSSHNIDPWSQPYDFSIYNYNYVQIQRCRQLERFSE